MESEERMNLTDTIASLATNAETIAAFVRSVSTAQTRWKPSPDAWSILEVLCHLYDEEREDFRLRLDLTLNYPEQPLPPIDPVGWVSQRAYQQRDLRESLEQFLAERQQSLVWLHSLDSPNWTRTCNSPHLRDMRAGDVLAAWVAHDLLHLRQLVELHYLFHAAHTTPYRVEYAGEW